MSLVQASISFFAFLQASTPSVVESSIRQFPSDVWKIIWTIHQWCLFKLESAEDSQLNGKVRSQLSLNTIINERQSTMNNFVQICRCLSTIHVSNRLNTVCATLVVYLRDLFLFTLFQWCSPRDQGLGLEAPRGQKHKSWSWSWRKRLESLDKKVLSIFKPFSSLMTKNHDIVI